MESGQIKYARAGGTALPLTSAKLNVTSLKFNLIGAGQNDDLQPLVTVYLEITTSGLSGESQKIKIQTSISQRNLDVEY